MISIKHLFENFRLPRTSQSKFKIRKKLLSTLPTNMFAKKLSNIKKMNIKLARLNSRFKQR